MLKLTRDSVLRVLLEASNILLWSCIQLMNASWILRNCIETTWLAIEQKLLFHAPKILHGILKVCFYSKRPTCITMCDFPCGCVQLAKDLLTSGLVKNNVYQWRILTDPNLTSKVRCCAVVVTDRWYVYVTFPLKYCALRRAFCVSCSLSVRSMFKKCWFSVFILLTVTHQNTRALSKFKHMSMRWSHHNGAGSAHFNSRVCAMSLSLRHAQVQCLCSAWIIVAVRYIWPRIYPRSHRLQAREKLSLHKY